MKYFDSQVCRSHGTTQLQATDLLSLVLGFKLRANICPVFHSEVQWERTVATWSMLSFGHARRKMSTWWPEAQTESLHTITPVCMPTAQNSMGPNLSEGGNILYQLMRNSRSAGRERDWKAGNGHAVYHTDLINQCHWEGSKGIWIFRGPQMILMGGLGCNAQVQMLWLEVFKIICQRLWACLQVLPCVLNSMPRILKN